VAENEKPSCAPTFNSNPHLHATERHTHLCHHPLLPPSYLPPLLLLRQQNTPHGSFSVRAFTTVRLKFIVNSLTSLNTTPSSPSLNSPKLLKPHVLHSEPRFFRPYTRSFFAKAFWWRARPVLSELMVTRLAWPYFDLYFRQLFRKYVIRFEPIESGCRVASRDRMGLGRPGKATTNARTRTQTEGNTPAT
jgi:hypothetical protein